MNPKESKAQYIKSELLFEGHLRIRRLADTKVKGRSRYVITAYDDKTHATFQTSFVVQDDQNSCGDYKITKAKSTFADLAEMIFGRLVKGFK